MDWEERMNRAMAYIDENLQSRIDFCAVAQFLNCSEWEFRRIFSFITQISLSEYIRRRRLTMAAADIAGGAKIMDVTLRYGYESPAAFSRAFRQLHGVSPSVARTGAAPLQPFSRLTFKLVLMEGVDLEGKADGRTSIYNGREANCAVVVDKNDHELRETNRKFWGSWGNEAIGTTTLPAYGRNVSEEECRFFADVAGKKVLEIGCGRGGSLQYLGERHAAELWGIDISQEQLAITRQRLSEQGLSATLLCAPMEEDCGLPGEYFDYVYSVYGIGWTTNLEETFARIASYLKKDGTFIFSWSHPIHKCVAVEHDMLVFKKCYFDEAWYSVPMGGGVFSLSDRKMSTYINALAKAGFLIEEMTEGSAGEEGQACAGLSAVDKKAQMLPAVFVIKARKL